MIADFGSLSLWLICLFSLIQFGGIFIFRNMIMEISKASVISCMILSLICFISLSYSHIISDFSIENVYQNSSSLKPLIYKFSGSWGSHEGSMILWILILCLFSFAFWLLEDIPIKAHIISIQGLIIFLFAIYTAIYSSPFHKIIPPPFEGLGLKPVLQDIGLAFHPPALYLGYLGMSIPFSFAVGILLSKQQMDGWQKILHKWVIISWIFLTLGIALGSWWAYRELGWGGYWFWDPVENASLMPWLVATALIHALIAKNYHMSILLAIMAFSLSMIGTFLVRSGILTSVHSFAMDLERGSFILLIIMIITGLGIFSYLFFPPKKQDRKISLYLLLNNILLLVALFTILLGTLYPLLLDLATGEKISVGAPYFNKIMGILNIPFIALAIFAPFFYKFSNKSRILLFVFSALLFILSAIVSGKIIAASSIILALILILSHMAKSSYHNRAMLISHTGFALIVMGIATSSIFGFDREFSMQPSESREFEGEYRLEFRQLKQKIGSNYIANQGVFALWKGNNEIAILTPEFRFYPIEGDTTIEKSIDRHYLLSDYYIAMGEMDKNNYSSVRFYYRPLINLLWIGALIIIIGGSLSLKRLYYR